jgi:hypothetical protein
VNPDVHVLSGQLQLSTSVVQPMLDLAQAAVQGLQLLVLLTDTKRPLAEDMVLVTQPLQLQRRLDGLLIICVHTHTLFDHGVGGVVLQVEEVLRVLHHLCPSSVELLAGEVTSSL